MKLFYVLIIPFLLFISACQSQDKTEFSQEAINQPLFSQDGQAITVGEVLQIHKGKTVMIEVWASWCPDCIKALPKVAKIQEEYPEVVYLFFSVDDKESAWKNGISKFMDKYNITGDQYFFDTGWNDDSNNAFTNDIDLTWIPRYMVINKDGQISRFNSKTVEDDELINALNQ